MASSRFRTALVLSLTVAVLVGLPFAIVARGGSRFSGDTPHFCLRVQAHPREAARMQQV